MEDVFISHASADKIEYINPLSEAFSARDLTFWLDGAEIGWGDSLVGKINEGLRESKFVLLCLSEHFLQRPWPESEMSAVLSLQNADGLKRALPLILNSKEAVVEHYPLIAGLAYREYREGPDKIAADLSEIVQSKPQDSDDLTVTIESAHTEKLCRLRAPKRASVEWLLQKALAGMSVSNELPISGPTVFHIRWVLVDVAVESDWERMPLPDKNATWAVIGSDAGLRIAKSGRERLEDLGVKNSTVFHLYPMPDERFSGRTLFYIRPKSPLLPGIGPSPLM